MVAQTQKLIIMKHYIVLPIRVIWNDEAYIKQSKIKYETKEEAIKAAGKLAKNYDCDFNIYSIECKVSSPIIVDYHLAE